MPYIVTILNYALLCYPSESTKLVERGQKYNFTSKVQCSLVLLSTYKLTHTKTFIRLGCFSDFLV